MSERTYSNYLLMENLLDGVDDSLMEVKDVVDRLKNPTVQVVEADCGTKLGKQNTPSFLMQGLRTLDGAELTRSVLYQIISNFKSGSYIYTRDLFSCQADGGICLKCLQGSFPELALPAVGDVIQIPNRYLVSEESIYPTLDGEYELSFDFSMVDEDLMDVVFYREDTSVSVSLTKKEDDEGFNVGYANITGANGSMIIARFYYKSLKPFFTWLSKTYSGAMLGVSTLPSGNTTLKHATIRELLDEALVDRMIEAIEDHVEIPSNISDYMNSITNVLEKTVYALVVYTIYGNIGT